MPTGNARLEAITRRIAARNGRNEADQAAADKLAAEIAKTQAEKQRRADNHAKILIGAAVLLLPAALLFRTMRMLCPMLTGRHRDSLEQWCKQRGIDITVPVTEELAVGEPQSVSVDHRLAIPVDPVGAILRKVIAKMDEGAFGLIAPDILAGAEGEDRATIEKWYAELDQKRE